MEELEELVDFGNKCYCLSRSETACNTFLGEIGDKLDGYSLADIVNVAQKKLKFTGEVRKLGFTVSTLINQKIRDGDVVRLELSEHYFGGHYRGKPVHGPISGVGYGLARGMLELKGVAGDYVGKCQCGGTLIVDGRVGAYLSDHKTGGRTVVKGNARGSVCNSMRGGVTKVLGDVWGENNCSHMKGGFLSVKGKLKGFSRYFKAGIVFDCTGFSAAVFNDWDLSSVSPLESELPRIFTESVLKGYMRQNGFLGWEVLVKNPEEFEAIEYEVRLDRMDQELPMIIEGIIDPEKKIRALKMLEREVFVLANYNDGEEAIKLAEKCGASVERAVERYNSNVKRSIDIHKRKMEEEKRSIGELRKKLL